VDQPRQHLGGAISGVGNELTRPKVKIIMGALDHPLSCRDLRLADSCACFNVDNDSVLHVDEIVGSVAELRLPTVRRRVARCWIDRRDARRHDRSGCAESRIVENGEILVDRAAR
jgi:hypothetical protein